MCLDCDSSRNLWKNCIFYRGCTLVAIDLFTFSPVTLADYTLKQWVRASVHTRTEIEILGIKHSTYAAWNELTDETEADSEVSYHSKVFTWSWLDVGHTHIHTHTKKKPSALVWVSLSPLCLFTLGSMTVIWSKRLYKDSDWGKLKPVVRF